MDKRLISFGGLLILCVTTSTHGQTFRSDYKKLKDDGWLKFHSGPQGWETAVQTCHFEGAVLASPINEQIRDELTLMMVRHGLIKVPIFIGIHNKYSPYVYQSMEGVSISDMELNWKNLPKGKFTENCTVMNLDGSVAESLCWDSLNFACYKNNRADIVNECGTVDREYVMSNVTGSCYKLHHDKRDWHTAYRICIAERGHLAVINSQKEAEVIRELAEEHSTLDQLIYIGFRTWTDRKSWLTIQGQSLYAAGYSKWAKEEPNNSTTGEYCGGVIVKTDEPYNDKILKVQPCKVQQNFICELNPRAEDIYSHQDFPYLN